jgi:hypothetical protein
VGPRVLFRLFAICAFASALIGCEGDVIPPCTAPDGVSVGASLDETPPALGQALRQHLGKIVAPGGRFDATDLVVTGHNRRLIFIWNAGPRWIVATERGGIGYSDPILAYDLSQDGQTALLVDERNALPETVCATASTLLNVRRDRQ